ncbi:Z1 domain-containing protein [Nocardia sp. NPDC050378]|uniref:Z1 domain-containing protein n=1 Tax=Nocardia sp. NPDC050378 TaxID=3155400 RepID=UPI0033CF0C26
MAKQVGALGPTGIRLSKRVQDLRQARGLTLGTLARRLGDLGRPIDLSALAKVEKGQRRVDVDDLVALALALDVSPNWLLLPDNASHEQIELAERFRLTSSDAWEWAVRDQPRDLSSPATEVQQPSGLSAGRTTSFFLRNEWADHGASGVARATQLRTILHRAVLADLAATRPKRLMRAMEYQAEDIGGAAPYADEEDLLWFLTSAGPEDPLIEAWRKQFGLWDRMEHPAWSPAQARTLQRRADVYGGLALGREVRDAFDSVCPVDEASPSVVVSTAFAPWYTPASQQQRAWYWPRYREHLNSKGWPTQTIHSLDTMTDAVVERLADPTQPQAYQSKGLVVGYVQSGKTANFTGVIAKAMDAGYRLVIVLGSTLNLLRDQTQRRLDQELVGRENILRGVSEYESDYCDDPQWVQRKFIEFGGMPSSLGGFDIVRLTTRHNDYRTLPYGIGALEFEKQEPDLPLYDIRNLHRSPARLMVVKKSKTVLRRLVKDLHCIGTPLDEIPALIIDDGSNEAPLNTTGLNPDTERSAINQMISHLLAQLPRAQYVGYTATPFANVLLAPEGNAEIFPKDFIVSLPRPDGYMGARDFHDFGAAPPQHERTFANSNELAHVRDVEFSREDDTQQLQCAIDTFVLTGAMKLFRQDRDSLGDSYFRHHTMLVHESALVEAHREMLGRITKLWWEAGYSDSQSHQRLRNLFDTDIAPVSAARAGAHAVPASFDELMPYIVSVVKRIDADQKPIIVVNSDKDLDTGDTDFDRRPIWKILISGQKLARGFTVEGLTVSYFRRRPTDPAALMQMGRWFGFRNGYQDLVRLYISRDEAQGSQGIDLYQAFEAVCAGEEALRAELSRHSIALEGAHPLTPDKVPQLLAQHVPLLRSRIFNKADG